MIFRTEITFDEIVDLLDIKNIGAKTVGCTLSPGIYEIIDLNFMRKTLPPNEKKVFFTIDDIRLTSNLTTD